MIPIVLIVGILAFVALAVSRASPRAVLIVPAAAELPFPATTSIPSPTTRSLICVSIFGLIIIAVMFASFREISRTQASPDFLLESESERRDISAVSLWTGFGVSYTRRL